MSPSDWFPRGPVIPEFDDARDLQMVRTRPRVGLHRLARYVSAIPPSERRSLLHYEKFPSPFRVSYAPVKRAFAEAIRLGWDEDTLFTSATKRWWAHRITGPMAIRRRKLCVDALVECCLMLGSIKARFSRLGAQAVVSATLWQPHVIESVRVADRPGLRLQRERLSRTEVGLVSFQMCKTRCHSARSAELAAVLVHEFARTNRRRKSWTVSPKLCFALDVQSGLFINADRGRSIRLLQTQLACQEIASRWPGL